LSKVYISIELREQVIERAGNTCEYCRVPADVSTFVYHIDHIIPQKQGGPTVLENLALACPSCNHYKGSIVVKYYYESGKIVLLFNPREDVWDEHFRLELSGTITAISETGEATVDILVMNDETRVEGRRTLIDLGFLTIK